MVTQQARGQTQADPPLPSHYTAQQGQQSRATRAAPTVTGPLPAGQTYRILDQGAQNQAIWNQVIGNVFIVFFLAGSEVCVRTAGAEGCQDAGSHGGADARGLPRANLAAPAGPKAGSQRVTPLTGFSRSRAGLLPCGAVEPYCLRSVAVSPRERTASTARCGLLVGGCRADRAGTADRAGAWVGYWAGPHRVGAA